MTKGRGPLDLSPRSLSVISPGGIRTWTSRRGTRRSARLAPSRHAPASTAVSSLGIFVMYAPFLDGGRCVTLPPDRRQRCRVARCVAEGIAQGGESFLARRERGDVRAGRLQRRPV